MTDHTKLLERLRTAPPNVLKDREAADAIAALQAEVARLSELSDSEGTRAVNYLRRARKAEAEVTRLRAVVQANHEWHQNHDEHDGYPESELCEMNTAAAAAGASPVEPANEQRGEVPKAPAHCPITGRKFWGNIDHPELGVVATYGGPFDTYTIPAIGEDGELRCERFDQDDGNWVDGGEPVGWFYPDQQAAQPAQIPDQNADGLALVRREAGSLILAADRAGVRVSLNRRPLQPLAMGHGEYVVETWEIRGNT